MNAHETNGQDSRSGRWGRRFKSCHSDQPAHYNAHYNAHNNPRKCSFVRASFRASPLHARAAGGAVMAAYYNENDKFAAQWLRNLIAAGLIAPGDVDDRSIEDVRPDDLAGYSQCHFFAGLGGWSYASRLAGWPDDRELWTGSCPCQPFSSAARGRAMGLDDRAKHLWPQWFRLIAARAPRVVFGEQVASARDWFDQVCFDMERLGHETAAAILPASGFGFDHERRRLYFASYSDRDRKPELCVNEKVAGLQGPRGQPGRVGAPDGIPPRMAVLGAFGNAIVPQVAAEFIAAFMDIKQAA